VKPTIHIDHLAFAPMQCRDCDAVLPPEARFCLSCGARVEPDAPDSTVDPLFETLKKAIGFQYRIERLLGRGGMGAVYLAHELALDRDVAIKVLPPEHASTPQMRERFRREARTAARLSHPHIVPLHTFGEVSGLVYFVMGYVAGESLASRLKRQRPFPPEEARTLLAAMCDALDYAHRQGIVHRDIKPDNILIDTASGAPLLTDFGIAKPARAEAQLTMTGQIIGTPHYMSPEQALGGADVDGRSDVYSLGVVAYEMISGRRPFDAENPMEALTQRLTRDPKPLGSAASDLPPDLALAVDRCLQRDVTKRWPDAKSLREALLPSDEESDDSLPARLLRLSATLGSLAVLAFVYLSVYFAINPDFKFVPKAIATITVAVVAMVMAGVATIRLRSYGLDGRSILLRALQQPRWWRSWYPRALRRRGDVWSRLPLELRRFRLCRGTFQIYALGAFLPLQLITITGHLPIVLRAALWATWFVSGLWVLAERRRATKFVRAKVGITAAEASAILTTSTFGVRTWRRPPISSLLDGQGRAPRRGIEAPAAGDTTTASERPTQL
jgi:serine/threonine protein kinase